MSLDQTQQFIDQATQSIQSGQFDNALPLLEQALALSPTNTDALILKGICLSQTGKPTEAADSFNKAIILEPNNAKAHFNLAVHQYAQGQKRDALEHAKAAATLDASHTGARQMISNLEKELGVGEAPVMPNPNDPLSQVQAPPSVTGMSTNPYDSPRQVGQPAGPHVGGEIPRPVQNPYMKDSYSAPTHSIPFVENLGGAWVAIGWILAGISLLGFVSGVVGMFSALGGVNFNDPDAINRAMESQSGMMLVSRIAGFASLIGILIWSIMDILDRRGNFVWLIPNIICSCCGFGWITLPIYILAGRNN